MEEQFKSLSESIIDTQYNLESIEGQFIPVEDAKEFIRQIQDECHRRCLRNGTIVLTEVYNIVQEKAGPKLT